MIYTVYEEAAALSRIAADLMDCATEPDATFGGYYGNPSVAKALLACAAVTIAGMRSCDEAVDWAVALHRDAIYDGDTGRIETAAAILGEATYGRDCYR